MRLKKNLQKDCDHGPWNQEVSYYTFTIYLIIWVGTLVNVTLLSQHTSYVIINYIVRRDHVCAYLSGRWRHRYSCRCLASRESVHSATGRARSTRGHRSNLSANVDGDINIGMASLLCDCWKVFHVDSKAYSMYEWRVCRLQVGMRYSLVSLRVL